MTDLGNITQHTLVSTSATCWYRWSVLALAVRQKGAVLRPEWYSDTRHWCQLVWMWILILFDLNFSKSACAFNVTSMFYISLERYIVRAVSVAFKPFRKREQPWNVRFFLAFLRIFCTILKHSIFSYIGFFYDLKTKRRYIFVLIFQSKTFKRKMKWQFLPFPTLGTGAKSGFCSFTHIGGCCSSPGSWDFNVLLSCIIRDHSKIISWYFPLVLSTDLLLTSILHFNLDPS